MDKWYGPHVQAVLLICKEESFEHDEKTNTKELIDMVLNNLDYPEDIEINEKRVKKDCSNFRAWRCIVPDEMESDVIRAEREHQSPIGKKFFFRVTLIFFLISQSSCSSPFASWISYSSSVSSSSSL